MDHPESCGSQTLEPSVGELLRYRTFTDGIAKVGPGELEKLKQLCEQLAYQVLVLHPSVVRFLVREVAGAPFTACHKREIQELLIESLRKGASGEAGALDG
jgi:hypothetical protein